MKDGLQNVSFDRVLMRVKDITSIVCNLITIGTVVLTALWFSFKQLQSQADQQKMYAELITRLPVGTKAR